VADYQRIDRELLEHIAEVSRLKLTDEELERFTEQLKVILDAFREIDEVDTEGVEPSFHPSELKDVLREDEARPWGWDPLGNSGHKERKQFKGPRIT
jgi:aspartyl-tRNA(Asn)/glutamyl-tRNA(Gln) amidotransferase subunit C